VSARTGAAAHPGRASAVPQPALHARPWPRPARSNLVRRLFEGRHAYVTRCLHCGHSAPPESSFFDMQVPVRGCASIAVGLRRSFEPSFLTGDNRYACGACGERRDAVRYQEVRRLPPMLLLNLERFAFDMETLERRKTSDAVGVSGSRGRPRPGRRRAGRGPARRR